MENQYYQALHALTIVGGGQGQPRDHISMQIQTNLLGEKNKFICIS